MSIIVKDGLFSLETGRSLYQMKIDETGQLLHLFYGEKTDEDMSYLIRKTLRAFCVNPYEKQADSIYSTETLPQEYSTAGAGDFRTPALRIVAENGSRTADLHCTGWRMLKGKTKPEGLPGVRGNEETEGIEFVLEDPVIGLSVSLTYYLFEEQDVITRSVSIRNAGLQTITLEKAATLCVDFPYGQPEVIHFHGRHCMERKEERVPVPKGGCLAFESTRGISSHHSNPFVILCDRKATENNGDCWGFMLMYSGNHLEEISRDQTGNVRIVAGIHPDNFRWALKPGESFQTPEAILTYSRDGLNGLSRNYHRIIREEVIHPRWRKAGKPVLLNSWEASYFDFDAKSLLNLAGEAKKLGMDMLVLDDGWFGKRNDDTTSLGDWTVNEQKLGCSLEKLAGDIHDLGLKFGLWVEPEMISEDSDLYRAHPDWALRDPDRKPCIGRHQMVLDMSREDTVDYLFSTLSALLDRVKTIDYLKWDFNRSVANVYSGSRSAEEQGETAHRFVLGTYRLLERLLARYPELMIEGCSGGGGRFDAGMLYYTPQIWCSDDTDAIERLEIQRGTSYGYPVCTMGAHVSACPNHQTGRDVLFHTRGVVAMSGTFGYELNPSKLTETERQEIRQQISDFRRLSPVISEGDYYRFGESGEESDFNAWMFVAPDKGEALVNLVMVHVRANGAFPRIRLQGLDPVRRYRCEETGETLTGAALMSGGYAFEQLTGDYPAVQLHWIRE